MCIFSSSILKVPADRLSTYMNGEMRPECVKRQTQEVNWTPATDRRLSVFTTRLGVTTRQVSHGFLWKQIYLRHLAGHLANSVCPHELQMSCFSFQWKTHDTSLGVHNTSLGTLLVLWGKSLIMTIKLRFTPSHLCTYVIYLLFYYTGRILVINVCYFIRWLHSQKVYALANRVLGTQSTKLQRVGVNKPKLMEMALILRRPRLSEASLQDCLCTKTYEQC